MKGRKGNKMTNKNKELMTELCIYAMAQDQRNLTYLTSLSILVAFSLKQQQMMVKYFSAFLKRVHPLVICKLMFAVCCGGKCSNYHLLQLSQFALLSLLSTHRCVLCVTPGSLKTAHVLFESITSVLPSKLSHLQ